MNLSILCFMFCVRWKQECARSAHEKKATRHRMKFHSCFENFRYQNLISCFDLQIYNNCGFAFIRILNVRDERIWCIPRLHYIFCVKWRWWSSSQQQNDRRRRCRSRFFSFVLVFLFLFFSFIIMRLSKRFHGWAFGASAVGEIVRTPLSTSLLVLSEAG